MYCSISRLSKTFPLFPEMTGTVGASPETAERSELAIDGFCDRGSKVDVLEQSIVGIVDYD